MPGFILYLFSHINPQQLYRLGTLVFPILHLRMLRLQGLMCLSKSQCSCVSELVSNPGVSASKACTFHGQLVSSTEKSMANPFHPHINAKFGETEVGAIGTGQ